MRCVIPLTPHHLPITLRKLTRWWICLFLGTFMLPIHAAQEEKILKKALEETQKHYDRTYKLQASLLASFGHECLQDTLQTKKDARFLYHTPYKNELTAQEKPFQISTWIEKITENDYQYLKKILSQNPEKKKPPKNPFTEALRIRLLVIQIKRKIAEQKAQPQKHPFWNHSIHTQTYGYGLVDYFNLPGLHQSILGIQSEQHPKLDETASDEILIRLRKGAKLFLENNPATLDHFKKTKKYVQDGKNTHYILTRHLNSERTDADNIIACDYRYKEEFLTQVITLPPQNLRDLFSSQKKAWAMVHLIYYPHAFHQFYQLKVEKILILHNEAAKCIEELTTSGHNFKEKPRFNAFYQEVRRALLERAKRKLTDMRAIDDLLERKKDKSIQKVLGKNVSFRLNGKTFWNSFLELKLHDLMCQELAQDLPPPKGIVNLKLGAEHGFRLHKAMMDVLQSDDEIISMVDNWMDQHRTSVQRRYFLYRIQKLMDEGHITNLTVHTSKNKKIEVRSIIKPQVPGQEGVALLETKQEINGGLTLTLPYNEMTDLYVDGTTHDKNYVAPLILTLASTGLAWRKFTHNTQEKVEGLTETNTTKKQPLEKRREEEDPVTEDNTK